MKSTGSYPRIHVDTAKVAAVGQADGILLTETIRLLAVEVPNAPPLTPQTLLPAPDLLQNR